MSVRKVTDIAELSIVAEAADYPDTLPNSGIYVIHEKTNKRYLLAIRNGIYHAWDISVYSDSGTLLTDAIDVYINASGEIISESFDDISKYLKIGFIVFAGYWIYKGFIK